MESPIANNSTDNLNSYKVNASAELYISDMSTEEDLLDENFSDAPQKTFSKLFTDDVFLSEKKTFELNFLDAIKNYELEDFYYSFADKTFDTYYRKYNIAAVEWLNHILLKNLSNPSVICGVLKVLSNIDYSKLQSFGYTMLLVVIHNNKEEDVEVTDLIISCIENWDDKAFIQILEGLKTTTNFLELYKTKILKGLAA